MARITFSIEDDLLRQIRMKARAEGRSLQAVVNDLLRRGLTTRRQQPYRLQWHGWQAKLLPGVDILSRDSLFSAMDDD